METETKIIYVIDEYDIGVEIAFNSLENAKRYLLNRYVQSLINLYTYAFNENTNYTTKNIVEEIQRDLTTLEEKGYIEEFGYIHSVNIMD